MRWQTITEERRWRTIGDWVQLERRRKQRVDMLIFCLSTAFIIAAVYLWG